MLTKKESMWVGGGLIVATVALSVAQVIQARPSFVILFVLLLIVYNNTEEKPQLQ